MRGIGGVGKQTACRAVEGAHIGVCRRAVIIGFADAQKARGTVDGAQSAQPIAVDDIVRHGRSGVGQGAVIAVLRLGRPVHHVPFVVHGNQSVRTSVGAGVGVDQSARRTEACGKRVTVTVKGVPERDEHKRHQGILGNFLCESLRTARHQAGENAFSIILPVIAVSPVRSMWESAV